MYDSSDETDEDSEAHPGGWGAEGTFRNMASSITIARCGAVGMSSSESMEPSSSSSLDMTDRWHSDGRDMIDTSSSASSYDIKSEPSDAKDT